MCSPERYLLNAAGTHIEVRACMRLTIRIIQNRSCRVCVTTLNRSRISSRHMSKVTSYILKE